MKVRHTLKEPESIRESNFRSISGISKGIPELHGGQNMIVPVSPGKPVISGTYTFIHSRPQNCAIHGADEGWPLSINFRQTPAFRPEKLIFKEVTDLLLGISAGSIGKNKK